VKQNDIPARNIALLILNLAQMQPKPFCAAAAAAAAVVCSTTSHPADLLEARLMSLAESEMLDIIRGVVEAMRIKWRSVLLPKFEAREARKIWKLGKVLPKLEAREASQDEVTSLRDTEIGKVLESMSSLIPGNSSQAAVW
jgi:hypothetical protein